MCTKTRCQCIQVVLYLLKGTARFIKDMVRASDLDRTEVYVYSIKVKKDEIYDIDIYLFSIIDH